MTVPALITEAEAAAQLGISIGTLRTARAEGLISYIRVTTRMIRYQQSDLDGYLERSRVAPSPGPRELAPLETKPKRPCVYFVRSGKQGPIKIGYAGTLSARLNALRTAHHQELILLATLAGGAVQEKRLHEQFAHLRMRGEWFEPAEELLRFIETLREPIA